MAIRVLERSSVSPPKDSVPETVIPLSFIDVLWLPAGPVDRLFFYKFPRSTSHLLHRVIPRLKSSLALTLQHFYPLAGHVRVLPDSDHKFEYHYKDGDSVEFTVAESDDDFDHLTGGHQRDCARLKPLIPNLVMSFKTDPLMALQVTLFPNHGVCVGIAIQHAVCDGTSTMNFVKSWAATCRMGATAAVVAAPPSFDRNVLVDPGNLRSDFVAAILKFIEHADEILSVAPTEGDVVFSTFLLKREEIEKLKRRILEQGWASDGSAYMAFAADARARLNPPVPYEYFGNCIVLCDAVVKVSDAVAEEEGVGYAAEAIGRAIDELKQGVLKGSGEWLRLLEGLMHVQALSIAGSPRFRVYDTDFGWGTPAKVEVTSIRKHGAISLAEAKGERGGIEIGFALPKPEMDIFTSAFKNGI